MLLSFTDVETTGFDSFRNQVITLSTFITDSSYKIINEFHGRFRPEGKKDLVWSTGAEDVHKISWEEAMEFPTVLEESQRYIEWLHSIDNDLEFVAHNMPYDRRMIRGTLFRNDLHFPFNLKHREFSDTAQMIKKVMPSDLKSRSLGNVCTYYGIDHNHHDAKSDAFVLIRLHEIICREIKLRESDPLVKTSGESNGTKKKRKGTKGSTSSSLEAW